MNFYSSNLPLMAGYYLPTCLPSGREAGSSAACLPAAGAGMPANLFVREEEEAEGRENCQTGIISGRKEALNRQGQKTPREKRQAGLSALFLETGQADRLPVSPGLPTRPRPHLMGRANPLEEPEEGRGSCAQAGQTSCLNGWRGQGGLRFRALWWRREGIGPCWLRRRKADREAGGGRAGGCRLGGLCLPSWAALRLTALPCLFPSVGWEKQ